MAGDAASWTDSHAHLAMEAFDPDREAVVARAKEAGVSTVVLIGTEPGDWGPTADEARRLGFPWTAGLHPHEASRWSEEVRLGLAERLDSGAAAVGEVGLDYHYDLSPRALQRHAFEAQCALAAERGLPVVVHSRKAFEDTAEVLRSFGGSLGGVIHCFTYGAAEAEAFLAMGFHLSFSGIATFPKAPEVREAARITPPERLLVETDAPYLAPPPHRGKRCEPAHAALVGRFLAEFLGMAPGELAGRTTMNAARLFGFG